MKKSLKLIPAIVMLLVSAILVSTTTFAWFSMNTTVTATGMKVTATASGSLIIKNAAPAAGDATTQVDFADASATALVATTHISGAAEGYSSGAGITLVAATGLKKNTNPAEVDAATGLQHGATALAFDAAVNNVPTGVNYYKDYTVYIAASGVVMNTQDLTITISAPAGVTTLPAATSVDFYYTTDGSIPTPSASTFAGTLNLAGLDPVTNDSSTARTSLVINGAGSGITIPLANGADAVVITMRVYIDGALKDSASTTYVKTVDAAEIADQTLTVNFTATPHA